MSSGLLYRKIMEDIRRKIEAKEFCSGDKIPTVNELRQLYGVSHITVLRAYRELQDSGIILQQGKRYIVNSGGNRQSGNRNLGCIGLLIRQLWGYNPRDNYFNEINYGIQDECSANDYAYLTPPQMRLINRNVIFTQRFFGELEKAALDIADRVDGFLLDERYPDCVIAKIMENTGKPCVLVNRTTELSIDTAAPQNEDAVKILCSNALRYGYRKFIFAFGGYRTNNDQARLATFEHFVREHNFASSEYRITEDYSLKHWTEATADMEKTFQSLHRGEKVAIISSSDAYARFILDEFTKKRLILHQHYGLAGIGGLGFAYNEKPLLTTVKIDAAEIGRLAVKALLLRISSGSGAPAKSFSPPAFFECGETL